MAYPLQINEVNYNSFSNDDYDALESNVPYISKNNAYSPKSKIMYNKFNTCDIFAFISVVTILLFLCIMGITEIRLYVGQNSREKNDNQPASIYTNYNYEFLHYYDVNNHDQIQLLDYNHHHF
jgi:hypothetical protein